MNTITAIKIDPINQTITNIELDKKNLLKTMYAEMNCNLVDKVNLTEHNDLIIDDEGLFKEDNGEFELAGYIFRGTALIVGHHEGEWVPCNIDKDVIVDKVVFTIRFADL
jgi:hypothetical protein